ncbi:MAG: extracellular solute-binding protein [Oscillospiraceae bacterium]|jgi:ABC-type glycerol-3-phosphate transport system substrate-binding protein|nr:extracellular solute-binding protein [Oscillospiraceae bacterium]
MKKSKMAVSILLAAAIAAGLLTLVIPRSVTVEPVTEEELKWAKDYLRGSLRNPSFLYTDFLETYGVPAGESVSLTAAPEGGIDLLEGGGTALYRVSAPAAGLYSLTLDCAARDRSFVSIILSVSINGEVQYGEAGSIDVPLRWADTTKDFLLDSFGDESVPGVEFLNDMRPVGLYNNTYITYDPILFYLEEGENTVALENKSARALRVGGLTVSSRRELPSYEEYREKLPPSGDGAVPTEAINGVMYTEKNTTFVQLFSTNTLGAVPYDPVNRLVNLTGFNVVGGEASYAFSADTGGWYAFALHVSVGSDDFPSFCTLRIDGGIPFAEAAAFKLPAGGGSRWRNTAFAGADGEPYYIWLEAGGHTLSLRSEAEPISPQLRDLRLLVAHINQFSLDVKKIAGREADKNRTWRFTRYMPETEDTLRAYDILLRGLLMSLGELSPRGTDASMLSKLVESVALLDKTRKKPDELPLYLEALSGDRVSVLISCGNALDDLMSLSFDLDMIYLYDGRSPLPRANPPFYKSISAMGAQLWASFFSPKYAVREDPEAINVWINASAMLTDALQKLADSRYTPATGIKVNFSIMPDQNKLVLASAGGTQPDIAMAIEHQIPYDLAVRGALYDLTRFDDFWETSSRFAPGAMVPYIFNDGVYALAESLDFQALVYREDVLDSLGIPPPDTWYDVCGIMSELQRFDMSFYIPIASGIGYKWFHQTSPLIYQFGGSFYRPDGLGTAINQPNAVKGITFLGELFTTYAVNEQVPSFFNAFRYGQTPVGIATNIDYLLIKYGAPELTGQWKLALPPGIPQEDGTVSRWYIANGRAAVIFDATDKPDECWDFLKWWTSEEIQTEYAFNLLSSYGYIFLPGNLGALENSYLPDEDKAVILESVKWLRDAPRSPGHYMLERTLSDIWYAIVLDGTPAQVVIDLKAIDIQREFRRKMVEFGYADAAGNLIKPYTVRELDWVVEQTARNRMLREVAP